MPTPITELDMLDPERVDAVGAPANGTAWLMLKAQAAKESSYEEFLKAKYSAEDLRRLKGKGETLPGTTSYPIADDEDLRRAIRAVGRGGADHDKIRRYIMERAKAMGHSDWIPDDWGSDGSLKKASNGHDAGAPPSEPYEQPTPPKGDGQGTTAPDKDLHEDEALSQTRELHAKADESEGAGEDPPGGDKDMTGDKAGDGDDAAAEAQAGSQTTEVSRKGGHVSGGNPANDDPGSAAWEHEDVGIATRDVQLLEEALTVARQMQAREKAEAAKGAVSNTAKGIEDMDEATLSAMVSKAVADAMDAREGAARKAAKKARKAEQKAAKAAADGQAVGTGEAAEAAKSVAAPVDVDAISKSVADAVKGALEGLNARLATVEAQPAARAMVNATGVAAGATAPVMRGQDGASSDVMTKAIAEKEAAFKAENDPERKARLGMELTGLKLYAFDRVHSPRPPR